MNASLYLPEVLQRRSFGLGNLFGNGVAFAAVNVFFSGFAVAYALSGVSAVEAAFAIGSGAVLLFYAKESLGERG